MSDQRNLYEAAMIIRNDPRFSGFRDFLDAEQKAVFTSLLSAVDEKQIFGAQGSYKAFQRIKDLIDGAPQALEKMAR